MKTCLLANENMFLLANENMFLLVHSGCCQLKLTKETNAVVELVVMDEAVVAGGVWFEGSGRSS